MLQYVTPETLTDMETLAVYDVRYLFGPQPAIALCKDI